MKVSKRGLAEIAAHEGIVLSKYKDSVGVWTIGIGHTKNAGLPNPATVSDELSLGEVMDIFARDIRKFENRVTSAFTRPLSQAQFDAAVSFDFNTGGIHKATWVKKYNAGDISGAKKSFMMWRKPPEIIPRRQAECILFFDGVYSGDGKVNVYRASSDGRVQWSSGKRVQLPSPAPIEQAIPPVVDAPIIPEMPKGLDKPMIQSKTNWLTLVQKLIGDGVVLLSDLDPRIQALLIIIFTFAAGYIIYERKRYRDEARAIKDDA
jgi:lysozyme